MKEPQKIIRKPWITEKSTRQKEDSGQYVLKFIGMPIRLRFSQPSNASLR